MEKIAMDREAWNDDVHGLCSTPVQKGKEEETLP